MKTIKELREEIAAKSRKLHEVFVEAGEDRDFSKVKSLEGDTKAKLETVTAMNKELDDLHDEFKKAQVLEDAAHKANDLNSQFNKPVSIIHPSGKGDDQRIATKHIGQLLMEKKAELLEGKKVSLDYDMRKFLSPELKTDFETTAGWAPESVRSGMVSLYPLRPLAVVDFIPQAPINQAAYVYMLETTASVAAAEVAEKSAYAEAQFALTATTETVRKITTSLPVTDEQLEDVPAAEAYIRNRLEYDLRQRLDKQVLEGNSGATPPEIKGTKYIGGSLQTQALSTDPYFDAIYKAFDLVRTVGFAEPSVLFINPADWQPMRLTRTSDGLYIMGNPLDPSPVRIWGVPLCSTTAVTANTAWTGDYAKYSTLFIRHGVDIQVGYDSDDFTTGMKHIRADMRAVMVHFRTAAFCSITGI